MYYVPDMCSRAEDNLLLQTISTKIRLNTYNPDRDAIWNLVTEAPAAAVPSPLHARCFFGAIDLGFYAYICWYYRAYRPTSFCVYLVTAKIALASLHPPRPYATRSRMHTSPLVIATATPSLWLHPPRD
jgi:hypothetical protein